MVIQYKLTILNKYADQKLIFTRDTLEGRLSEAVTLIDVHDEYLVFRSLDTGHYSLKNIHFDTQNDLTDWLDEHVIGYQKDVNGLVINWSFKEEAMKIFAEHFPSDYDYKSNYSDASETYSGSIVFDLNCSRYTIKPRQDLVDNANYLKLNTSTIFLQHDGMTDAKFFLRPVLHPYARIQYMVQSSSSSQIISTEYLEQSSKFDSNNAHLFIDTCNCHPEYHEVRNKDAIDFFISLLPYVSFVGECTYYIPSNLINAVSPEESVNA